MGCWINDLFGIIKALPSYINPPVLKCKVKLNEEEEKTFQEMIKEENAD